MPRAVFAADPTNIVVVQAGVAYHRRMYAPDKKIGAYSDSSLGSIASKWGMAEIDGAPEVGDGFPVLKFSNGKYRLVSAFSQKFDAISTKNCGTGAGGFKPGNTCGSGGSASSAVQAWAKKKFKNPKHAEAFVKWFGDSKVVDDKGEPLVVYHGTNSTFSEFDSEKIGERGDHAGRGFYLSTSTDTTAEYSQGEGGSTMPLYVSMQQPFDASQKFTDKEIREIFENASPEQRAYFESKRLGTKPLEGLYVLRMLKGGQNGEFDSTEVLEKSGFDGIVHYSANPQGSMGIKDSGHGKVYVAFRPNQIKSATGNAGTFDSSSNDIGKFFAGVATKFNISKNCGTGAGGFKPGNTCARGGSGVRPQFTSANPGDAKEDRDGLVAGDDIRVVESAENTKFDDWATGDRFTEVRSWGTSDEANQRLWQNPLKADDISVENNSFANHKNKWSRGARIAMKVKIAAEVGEKVSRYKDAPSESECESFLKEYSSRGGHTPHEESAAVIIDQWASSSNGQNPLACAIQLSAERTVGIKNARKVAADNEDAHDILAKHGKVLDAVNRAIYENTQEKLEAAGVDGLVLYRGMKWNTSEKVPDVFFAIQEKGKIHTGISDPSRGHGGIIKYDDISDLQLNPISSFATTPAVAVTFASSNYGAVAGTYVPRKEIFSTALTGVGCLSESEAVVFHRDDRPYRMVIFQPGAKLNFDKLAGGKFWEHQDDE